MSSTVVPESLEVFLGAMQTRDPESLTRSLEGMSEDVTLNSPIVAKAFEGKPQVGQVLKAFLSIVDSFTIKDTLSSETGSFAVLVAIRSGDTEIGGVYYATFTKEGQIQAMTIQWRALAEIVYMQNKIAPLIGGQALVLVPKV